MTSRLVPGLLAAVLGCVVAIPAFANSNGIAHAHRTWRDVQTDSGSCGACHGSRGSITVTLTGPASLYPGQQGNYTVALTGGTNGEYVGAVISSTDVVTVNPFSASPPLVQQSLTPTSHNLVHQSPPSILGTSILARVAGGTASYSFPYTMPADATVGSTRTLHAVMRTGIGSGANDHWNHANFSGGVANGLVVTTANPPPAAPFNLTNPSKTASSVQLAWSGSGPAYRVVYKPGSTPPANESDGTIVNLANLTTTTIGSLNAGPRYTFRVYARTADNSLFSLSAPTIEVVLPPAITSSAAAVNGNLGAPLANYTITGSNSPTSYGATNLPPGVSVNPSTGLVSGTPTARGGYAATITATNGGGTGSSPKFYNIVGLAQSIAFGAAPSPTFSPGGTFTVTATASSGLPVAFSQVSANCFVQSATANSAVMEMTGAGACEVRANQAGNATYEPATEVSQTVTIAAGPPAAPTISAALAADASAIVVFSAPSNNGGSPILSYTASCAPGPVTATGATSPITVTGLANGSTYSCSVTATNAAGTGPASATADVVPTPDPDGTLDAGFGTGGLAVPVFSNAAQGESLRAILVDSKDRILVGGSASTPSGAVMAIARLAADGTLDTGFGTGGIQLIESAGPDSFVSGLALAPDDGILFAGNSDVSGNAATFTVGKLLPDGGLDPAFGTGGLERFTNTASTQGNARTIAYSPATGEAVAAGWGATESQPLKLLVARVNAVSGKPVDGFGNKGLLRVDVGVDDPGNMPEGGTTGIAVDDAGLVYASGFFNSGSGLDVFLLRADATGADATFGVGGLVKRDVQDAGASDVAFAMARDAAGRLNVTGYSGAGGNNSTLLLRFLADGTLDQEVVQDQGGNVTDIGTSLVIHADGRRLVGGIRNGGATSFDFNLSSYTTAGALDTSFAGSGRKSIPSPGLDQIVAMAAHVPGTVVAATQINGVQRVARFVHDAPLPFAFTPALVTEIGTDTVATSNAVALQGLVGQTYVMVTGGQWSRNCAPGAFTSGVGVVGPGDTVCVRHTTASTTGVKIATALRVGGQVAEFSTNPSLITAPKTLTITKAGGGIGNVLSSPAGLSCGTTCSASFATNQVVTIFANPAAGSVFGGWSGACSGTSPCDVTMDVSKSVTATFNVQQFGLTVAKAGAGSGVVVSSVAGIDCGASCGASFDTGTVVTLVPSPATGSAFTGWSGACTGSGACVVTMDAARSVTATFALQQFALSVATTGAGSGAVSSTPAGIDCGAACGANYDFGTTVTLTPQPAAGSLFAGWSGACMGTGACQVAMTAAQSVTAGFSIAPPSLFTLTVTKEGAGAGTVGSAPAGIDCGETCFENFAADSTVTLTPSPALGSVFAGWSGACTGTGACNVTMSQARDVTATFSIAPVTTFALTITKTGGGGGVVTSTPGGIDCGATCSANFNSGASVALGAAPTADSFFAGWSGGGCSGTGACNVTMSAAQNVTATFKLNTTIPRLANISTRMQVLTGNDVLIGGFIIGGTQPKTVVVRARGPSLIPFGITNALLNPTMQLFSGQTVLATSDDWGTAANAAAISSSGFAPSSPQESAILTTLGPGAYTAVVSGVGGTTGVGIIEVFEVDKPEVPLANISTRGQVLTGNDVMIGGFVIQGDSPQTVTVRARGPSLIPFGITNALADPVLELLAGQVILATNDDWQSSADAAAIQASGFAPSDAKEAVIRITLPPGAYTAIVRGKNGGTGVGIIEAFAQ